jgi:hypothetical protein
MIQAKLRELSDESLCERTGRDDAAQEALFLRHIEPVTHFLMRRFSGIEHEAIAAEALTDALSYVGRHGRTDRISNSAPMNAAISKKTRSTDG